jgi:glycosyltransferase involved in cell wall biosynthesis
MAAGPLVSIITPTYNRQPYLREAVESVLAQSYGRWEMVIVDDGSTDGTRAYLETLADPRVRVVRRAHCGNAAVGRNVAARAAQGVYYAFLDHDDLWLPEKLAVQLEDLRRHPECGWSYVADVYVDEQAREMPSLAGRWAPYGGWILEPVLDCRARIATSAVMVEKRLFEAVGGFTEPAFPCEDLDLWIRLAEASPAAVVSLPLVKKRVHPRDHSTTHLAVQACMNRIYGDFLSRTDSARLRRRCRRQRARVNVNMVDACRWAGAHADAREALRVSFRYAGWSPAWWIALLKTLLRPVVRASAQPG